MPINCADHPFLTVVIATLGQSEHLRECVQSVLNQGCEGLEIIVVRSGSPAAQFPELEGLPVRVIGQARLGVSRARNAAIPHARGEVLAFLDDDVRAEPRWAHAVAQGFTDPLVYCVAGRVAPEGAGYMPVERYTSPRIMARWFISREQADWIRQAISVDTGFGCNMAFRRSFLEEVSFPEHFGSGSKIGAADEPYMFFQVVRRGFTLLHAPDAVVTHFFGDNAERSRERVGRIHSGNIAFHLKMIADFPGQRMAFLRELLRRGFRAMRHTANDSRPAAMSGFTLKEKLRILVEGCCLFWNVQYGKDKRPCFASPKAHSPQAAGDDTRP